MNVEHIMALVREYGVHFAEASLHQSSSKADVSQASALKKLGEIRAALEAGAQAASPPQGDALDAKDAALRQAIDALDWYATEAEACAKNSNSARHEAPQALLASVTVLALDGGKRARAAIDSAIAAKGHTP